jgi:hypothetical protein
MACIAVAKVDVSSCLIMIQVYKRRWVTIQVVPASDFLEFVPLYASQDRLESRIFKQ